MQTFEFATSDLIDLAPDTPSCEIQFRSFGRRSRFCGRIRTVKCFRDNGLIKQLMNSRSDGEVIVDDGGYTAASALMGDMGRRNHPRRHPRQRSHQYTGFRRKGPVRQSAQKRERRRGGNRRRAEFRRCGLHPRSLPLQRCRRYFGLAPTHRRGVSHAGNLAMDRRPLLRGHH